MSTQTVEGDFSLFRFDDGIAGIRGLGFEFEPDVAEQLVRAGYLHRVGRGKYLPTWLGLLSHSMPGLWAEALKQN